MSKVGLAGSAPARKVGSVAAARRASERTAGATTGLNAMGIGGVLAERTIGSGATSGRDGAGVRIDWMGQSTRRRGRGFRGVANGAGCPVAAPHLRRASPAKLEAAG